MKSWSRIAFAAAVIAATAGVTTASLAATSGGADTPAAYTARPASQPLKAPTQSGKAFQNLAATPQTKPELLYVPVTPCRIVDTRKASGPIAANGLRIVNVSGTIGFAPQGGVAGGCGIPANALSFTGTLGVIAPSGSGGLKSWPNGSPEVNAAAINYFHVAGAVSSGVTLTIRPSAGQNLVLRNLGPAVHIYLDVSGYFVPHIQGLIGADGSISTGTSRIVAGSHPGTGSYYITLDRPARECSPSAATYNLYHYISVGLSSSSTPNVISVYSWVLDPTTHKEVPSDYPFFLQVSC
ncbi:MAG: hypothetical protein JWN95_2468 [Frankiales bacterium]|nr:hypothetical protein [Frankiales bacterium]